MILCRYVSRIQTKRFKNSVKMLKRLSFATKKERENVEFKLRRRRLHLYCLNILQATNAKVYPRNIKNDLESCDILKQTIYFKNNFQYSHKNNLKFHFNVKFLREIY